MAVSSPLSCLLLREYALPSAVFGLGCLGLWFVVGWLGLGLFGLGHTLDTLAADTTFQSARDCACVFVSIAACPPWRAIGVRWFLVAGCLAWVGWVVLVGFLLVGRLAPHWPSARRTLDSESVNDCPPLPVPPRLPFDVEELPRVRLAPGGLGLLGCWFVVLVGWVVFVFWAFDLL
jgi:hypothetical protein